MQNYVTKISMIMFFSWAFFFDNGLLFYFACIVVKSSIYLPLPNHDIAFDIFCSAFSPIIANSCSRLCVFLVRQTSRKREHDLQLIILSSLIQRTKYNNNCLILFDFQKIYCRSKEDLNGSTYSFFCCEHKMQISLAWIAPAPSPHLMLWLVQ